jgi:hypothetical protein
VVVVPAKEKKGVRQHEGHAEPARRAGREHGRAGPAPEQPEPEREHRRDVRRLQHMAAAPEQGFIIAERGERGGRRAPSAGEGHQRQQVGGGGGAQERARVVGDDGGFSAGRGEQGGGEENPGADEPAAEAREIQRVVDDGHVVGEDGLGPGHAGGEQHGDHPGEGDRERRGDGATRDGAAERQPEERRRAGLEPHDEGEIDMHDEPALEEQRVGDEGAEDGDATDDEEE